MTQKNTIKVPEKKAGFRLDVFLSEELGVSRSQAQKIIESGRVIVNEKIPKKSGDKLVAESVIKISSEKKESAKTIAQKKHKTKLKVKIIAETDDYVVLEKPAGMLTHPTMAEETDSLVDFILEQWPKVKNVGEDPVRPGIVHRLDKEASGLMVVAKTQKMFEHLKDQFKKRTVNKEYHALVHGRVARDWGEINFPIARTNDRMAAVPESQERDDAKEAKTDFLVEKRFVNFTLLKIKIHTGRMHQIRVHMLAYNSPLVGDPLYFQKKQKRVWDEKLGRLFLHSTKLEFNDLSGERVSFESPLPKRLEEFLTEIR